LDRPETVVDWLPKPVVDWSPEAVVDWWFGQPALVATTRAATAAIGSIGPRPLKSPRRTRARSRNARAVSSASPFTVVSKSIPHSVKAHNNFSNNIKTTFSRAWRCGAGFQMAIHGNRRHRLIISVVWQLVQCGGKRAAYASNRRATRSSSKHRHQITAFHPLLFGHDILLPADTVLTLLLRPRRSGTICKSIRRGPTRVRQTAQHH
jgi:hypothetical protein